MANFAENWNGHLMCAVDTETTGLDPRKNEIIEVCVLPLDSNIKPRKDLMPFNITIKPDRLEYVDASALKINKKDLPNLLKNGFEKFKAADLLDEYVERLNLAPGKKIMPLAHNWPFDKEFLESWLGVLNFQYLFDYHFRDTCSVAQYMNDRAVMHAEKPPFSRVNLKYLCSQYEIRNQAPHTALGDCLATAEVYRQMIVHGPLLAG
jgi:DNA polymerase III epsilon subunit-like protein